MEIKLEDVAGTMPALSSAASSSIVPTITPIAAPVAPNDTPAVAATVTTPAITPITTPVVALASAATKVTFGQPSMPPFASRATNSVSAQASGTPLISNPSVSAASGTSLTPGSSVLPASVRDGVSSEKVMSAYEYIKACGFFGGPTVTITVGFFHKPYILPKAYLCSQSPYFLNQFEFGIDRKTVPLSKAKPRTFELVIQWIYTGQIVLYPSKIPTDCHENIIKHNHEMITAYVDFFLLCEELEIDETGYDSIILKIKSILLLTEDALGADHIHSAMDLADGHLLRKLFAQAVAKEFILSKEKGPEEFKFASEVIEYPGHFARDLVVECRKIFASITTTSELDAAGNTTVAASMAIDPFTGQYFKLLEPHK